MANLVRRQVTYAGNSFSVLEGGPAGDACRVPSVIWSHAAGFHAAAYGPLLRRLARETCVQARDARGHGESQAPRDPALLHSWHVYYDDLVASLDSLPSDAKVVLAGHSTGATSSVFAAARRPDRVSRLVLVEPVFYPPGTGIRPRKNLMRGAQRRRSSFPSLNEAFELYRSRPAFRSISDEWLHSYVDNAFVATKSGDYELRCSPTWEYRTFDTNERWPWWAIIRARVPTVLLLTDNGSSCPTSARIALRVVQPSWPIKVVPNTSHLLPMETPDVVFHAVMSAVRAG